MKGEALSGSSFGNERGGELGRGEVGDGGHERNVEVAGKV